MIALWYYQYNAANVETFEAGNDNVNVANAARRAAELQAEQHGVYVVGYQWAEGFVSEADWPDYHAYLDDRLENNMPVRLRCKTRTVAVPWHCQGRTDIVDIPTHWPDWIGA